MKKLLLSALLVICSQRGLSQCATLQSATVNPLPVNNSYLPGTSVIFCFTVDSFSQSGTNWFHGVILNFGTGWDPSTFAVTSLPAGCDANGVWGYYQSCTSSASGQTFGPGFYYDNIQSSTTISLDGIPGNNFGDDGTGCINDSWTFCFSMDVDSSCEGGGDLSATATVTGDGTTGSWSNNTCSGIAFDMISGITCGGCSLAVNASGVNPLCAGEGGSATAAVTNGVPPYSYSWSPGGQTTATAEDLTDGTYNVVVIDSTGCTASSTVTIVVPSQLIADAGNDTTLCIGETFTLGGNPTVSGGTPPYHYAWEQLGFLDTSNPVIIINGSEVYEVIATDTNQCVVTDSVMIDAVICEGISNQYVSPSFDIFPNPNNGVFTIILSDALFNEGAEMILSDLSGKELLRITINAKEQKINLPGTVEGIYLVEIKSGLKSLMKKIISLK